VRRDGQTCVFTFVGKSGVEHVIAIDDRASVRAVAELRRRRGGFDELLGFKEGGRWHRLTADVVNDYVRDVTGLDVTAKDFRTWHATVLAAVALADDDVGTSRAARKRQRVEAMKEVADYLGNTPAMARTSYVDPRVLEHHEQGRTIKLPTARAGSARWQEAAERSVVRLLSNR
jgi:DNA topoisomerase IB